MLITFGHGMKDEDWQALLNELRGVDVQLPLHQEALKKRLLSMHASRAARRRRLSQSETQMLVASRRILSLGVAVVVTGLLVLGLLAVLPMSHNAPAKKLIAKVVEPAPSAPPVKAASIGRAYPHMNRRSGDRVASSSQHLRTVQVSLASSPQPPSVAVPVVEPAAPMPVQTVSPPKIEVVITFNDGNPPLSVADIKNLSKEERKVVREAVKLERKEAKAAEKALHRGLADAGVGL